MPEDLEDRLTDDDRARIKAGVDAILFVIREYLWLKTMLTRSVKQHGDTA